MFGCGMMYTLLSTKITVVWIMAVYGIKREIALWNKHSYMFIPLQIETEKVVNKSDSCTSVM